MAVVNTHQHPRLPEFDISGMRRERFAFTKLAADAAVACTLQHMKTAKQVIASGVMLSWSQAGQVVTVNYSVLAGAQQTNGDIIILGKARGEG